MSKPFSLMDLFSFDATGEGIASWFSDVAEHPNARQFLDSKATRPEFSSFYHALCLGFVQKYMQPDGSLEKAALAAYVSLNGLPNERYLKLRDVIAGIPQIKSVYRNALFGMDFALRNTRTLDVEVAVEAEMMQISKPRAGGAGDDLFFLRYTYKNNVDGVEDPAKSKPPLLNDLDKLLHCPSRRRLYIGRIAGKDNDWVEKVKYAIQGRINSNARTLIRHDDFWVILGVLGACPRLEVGHTINNDQGCHFVWSLGDLAVPGRRPA